MDSPKLKIPNLSADWKLNSNVECRITLNKLKIKTPEYGTMEFCRTLRNLWASMEPAPAVSTSPKTTDMHFKSEFVLGFLLNEILGKCEEKCKVCEEYVQQLRHHISQAHSGHPNPSPHPQTVTVFKCDVCSSMYSSPSMLIRHRNTHSVNSDTLATPCSNEPEPVRFDSTNIYTSFDHSSVTTRTENVSSGQCEIHPHQPVTVLPINFELNYLKQEELSSSQSELEISSPNPLGILQHVNHLSTIENNLKQESDDLECQDDLHDPLLLQDVQVPSSVKSECTGNSTDSEQQTIVMTHEKISNDTPAGRESFPDLNLTTYKMKKPLKCPVCGKCFGKLKNLRRHKLTHTGEKPHECKVCGKSFVDHSNLIRHKSIHTGERPYGCDVCEMSFRRSDHLARHKLTHTSREKPFHCDVCGQSFYQGYELSKHKLKHTWQSTNTTFVNHLKEERESEKEGCQEDPLLNLDVSSYE